MYFKKKTSSLQVLTEAFRNKALRIEALRIKALRIENFLDNRLIDKDKYYYVILPHNRKSFPFRMDG